MRASKWNLKNIKIRHVLSQNFWFYPTLQSWPSAFWGAAGIWGAAVLIVGIVSRYRTSSPPTSDCAPIDSHSQFVTWWSFWLNDEHCDDQDAQNYHFNDKVNISDLDDGDCGDLDGGDNGEAIDNAKKTRWKRWQKFAAGTDVFPADRGEMTILESFWLKCLLCKIFSCLQRIQGPSYFKLQTEH